MESKTLAIGAKIELNVPATREMMLVIRLTTAAVMARAGISADGMDDMKMAVEEAATCLMQTSCISEIRMCYERTKDGCVVRLRGVPNAPENCNQRQNSAISDEEVAVVRCILETMADEVALKEEDGCIRAIELLKWTNGIA